MDKKNIFLGVVVYLFSVVISYLVFAGIGIGGSITSPVPSATKDASGKSVFDDSLPKTESCPLNGVKYSKQQRKWWESHSPLGIMIENHKEARPQSGLVGSDIIYEAVAEGGITRFLAVFYCQDAGIVGPVRSARTYFLDYISEYGDNPLYAHVGGANTSGPADALSQIEKYGWQSYNDLNQFSIGFPTFWRDYERIGHEVATEHTMYSSVSKLWDYAASKRGLTNVDEEGNSWDDNFVPYTFKNDAVVSERPESQVISFNFWSGYSDYSVKWTYDKASNEYLRTNGGEKHTDLESKKQLSAKNIVFLYETEGRANDGYEGNLHMLYGTKGTGKATIFMDGEEISGTWSKKLRTSRTIIRDARGKEISFNPGRIWFEIVAIGNDTLSIN